MEPLFLPRLWPLKLMQMVARVVSMPFSPMIRLVRERVAIPLHRFCTPTVCEVSTGQTGGPVFNNYNANGIKENGESTGVAGVTVTAYDCNGNSFTTTTDEFGLYSFTGLTAGSSSIRVEFSNLPGYAGQGTPNGTDGNTTVQFVDAPDCTVDLGVLDQNDFCQSNPEAIVPCFVAGNPQHPASANDGALVGVGYDLSGG